ncbi:MAG: Gfo/Idh/MocA family oxidoreductase [Ignavibacteriae bacterium]|nr:Gfo/Idh/MocA family oxidoreductase [Ignavibacteriota bacterium]
MKTKINWGILGTATIAIDQIIPSIQKSYNSQLVAIASRNFEKAKIVSEKFSIPKYYGKYEELLRDPEIDAVYIPLPNHLHVEFAIKSLENGKNVLVEKPIGMNKNEIIKLIETSNKYPNLKIMEAFMYKFHPQWKKSKELITNGKIGELNYIQSSFTFYDDNPNSIVNKKEYGGGSLMDIGCYSISLSNYLFEKNPKTIFAVNEIHPNCKIDITTSVILEYLNGCSSFFCSTQMEENQNVKIFGTKGIIELPKPFNPSNDKKSFILLTKNNVIQKIEFEICNQYEKQISEFSESIITNKNLPTTLNESLSNINIIEKIFESAEKGEKIFMQY